MAYRRISNCDNDNVLDGEKHVKHLWLHQPTPTVVDSQREGESTEEPARGALSYGPWFELPYEVQALFEYRSLISFSGAERRVVGQAMQSQQSQIGQTGQLMLSATHGHAPGHS